ncbi:MAG: Flp pilus assembly protein CpaB [Methylocella sp.]
MKTARLTVLGVSLVAGIGAAVLASGSKPPAVPPPPPPSTDDVLVASKELDVGNRVDAADLRWDAWPKDHIPVGLIRKSASPAGIEELQGSIARANFAPGEPLRREHLSKGSDFLAAVLRPGMRAVAINIDAQGSSTAGGSILPPNDRVDVVHTFLDAHAGNSFFSQIILTNIRVLAIGQNFQEKNGEHVVNGVTATLEVTPTQAETLVLAQRTGQLSLILRSMTDAKTTGE